MSDETARSPGWHATTILMVRKGGKVVIGGDGQVSMGQTVVKSNARKVRRLAKGDVIAGFAGATADAFTLFERLEAKLDQYPGQLARACVELAKDWRTDRYLRRLEAMLIVADKDSGFTLSGSGDVLEPEADEFGSATAIGSGGNYALAAARADPAHFSGVALHHGLSKADLAVPGHCHVSIPPDAQDGGAVPPGRVSRGG